MEVNDVWHHVAVLINLSDGPAQRPDSAIGDVGDRDWLRRDVDRTYLRQTGRGHVERRAGKHGPSFKRLNAQASTGRAARRFRRRLGSVAEDPGEQVHGRGSLSVWSLMLVERLKCVAIFGGKTTAHG